ncbi:Predicted arabinose efflux permease, MFS family [Actinacidiphila alni]|uniref:Predicted arabinose efflux permease, MFS family n=1 Tax=Actinacidiphila alni TaxID=380248 RepID=A0A1I2JP37_9ACTN|nr:MFS transporter [Actinacidiphila alni]SFF55999.1 Predicted arabinose efflux permease, MFS family [Actinacidiphila alni]
MRIPIQLPPIPGGPDGRRMLWINLIDKTGSGLWVAVTALYFVVIGGLGTAQAGLLLGLGGAAGIAGAPVAGRLADRLPLTRVLFAVQLLRGASSLLLLLAHGFWQLLPLVALGSFGERAASVLTKLFAARVAGPERARYQAVQRTVVNVGYTIGGLGASAALAIGTSTVYRALLLGDALSFVLVAALVARCAEPPSASRTVTGHLAAAPPVPGHVPPVANPWRDRGYLAYAALDSAMFLYGCALSVGMPLWIITRTDAPHGLAAAIFVVNTVIVVAFQVRLSRYGRSPRVAADSLRRVAVWFLLSGAATATAVVHTRWTATAAVLAAAVAFTVVEMIQSAVSWELSVALAPDDAQGAYVGVHGLAQSTSRCIGPLLMTSVVIATGPAGWIALGAVLAAAALLQRRLVLRRLGGLERPTGRTAGDAGTADAGTEPSLSVPPITVSEH